LGGCCPGLLLVELAGVVGTVAVEGHAAAGAWPTARLPLDVAHVAAAGVWLGGLAMLTGAALPAARRSVLVPVPCLSSSSGRECRPGPGG
jgi:putative copper export protein